jgi:hypothetical protein
VVRAVHAGGVDGPGAALVVAAALLSLSGCTRTPRASLDSPLTSVEQVRRLPIHSAGQVPVRLRGVITYADSDLAQFFFQDSTGGLRSDNISDNAMLEYGSFVELTGTVAGGGPSPAGAFDQIRLLKAQALPPPVRARAQDQASGKLQ